MDAGLAALIGAFGGAGIGFAGALKVAADQRSDARRSEKRRAMASYLGALYPVVSELKEMPPNKEPDLIEKAVDHFSSEQLIWLRTRKGVVAMSPHMFGRQDRLSSAFAHLQLLDMPAPVMDAVEAANNYTIELGEERSEAILGRWRYIHEDLLDASKLLDAQGPRWWRPFFG